ncbi:N-acetylglucosaminyldiphosphoundecaprenol N-acetyl-beta-D-mannosaminyltransferase [Gracilibacillus ureilyticus]|uniref:N-acetylglucosaminyldiphosphoundecaprenol N-acetyl-beta-D-mannosaminyltransferase n=1 Tax=Gracilibacillus ureilyticus TaxID=531814 RepID=A0A1H9RDU6_9BACI|nr:WecB/TagA/CpsF family glycosyltransferase [Gracilibacillus ureilyticus]SER70916.1 N-acetylglucosaminyldiphosphoundecaprenol N-acetyl-beta-D-mannosaminyltransferase [Gracilibacillus ureilyticus]
MDNKVEILGIPFSTLTLTQTTVLLEEHITSNPSRMFHLITANPEITITSQTDKQFQKIMRGADLITPDGIGIVMASRMRREPIAERVTGFDLLHQLLDKGNQHGWSFYFLGTDEDTNNKAVEKIKTTYPNVTIAGRHHGFFSNNEEEKILMEIKHSTPDILIVAMGAPHSDKWIHKHKDTLDQVGVVFGVGGSLDVIAGKVKATPDLWKKLNLEWLHRLMTVPVAKGQKSRWLRQSSIPKFIYQAVIRKR